MLVTWDERKRVSNLRKHGLDFADAPEVFAGPTYTFEDARLRYTEPRFVTFGSLREWVVALVHTEREQALRIISMRRATRREREIYYQAITD